MPSYNLAYSNGFAMSRKLAGLKRKIQRFQDVEMYTTS